MEVESEDGEESAKKERIKKIAKTMRVFLDKRQTRLFYICCSYSYMKELDILVRKFDIGDSIFQPKNE